MPSTAAYLMLSATLFSVGLVVGGSIVIPHLRRGVDFLDRIEAGANAD